MDTANPVDLVLGVAPVETVGVGTLICWVASHSRPLEKPKAPLREVRAQRAVLSRAKVGEVAARRALSWVSAKWMRLPLVRAISKLAGR